MNCPVCENGKADPECFTCDGGKREIKEGIGWFHCKCKGKKPCKHYIPNCCMSNWLCGDCSKEPGYIKDKEGFGVKKPRPCELCTVYLF